MDELERGLYAKGKPPHSLHIESVKQYWGVVRAKINREGIKLYRTNEVRNVR